MTPDGKEAAITGPAASVGPGMTAALKVTGPRTFDLSMKMNGSDIAIGRFTVSADGKSMAVDSTFGPAGPAQEHATATYDKLITSSIAVFARGAANRPAVKLLRRPEVVAENVPERVELLPGQLRVSVEHERVTVWVHGGVVSDPGKCNTATCWSARPPR